MVRSRWVARDFRDPSDSATPPIEMMRYMISRQATRGGVQEHGQAERDRLWQAKRLVRFLKGVGPVKFNYEMQEESEAKPIMVYVDSDWAGCQRTRRSTTGGVMKVERHVVRTWSATQPTAATASGEAELIAIAEGASRGLGLGTMMMELGFAHGHGFFSG